MLGEESYFPSPAYIAMGLLDEIQEKQLKLRVLTGGEGSIGYCHVSMPEFQDKIRDRQQRIARIAKYQRLWNSLER